MKSQSLLLTRIHKTPNYFKTNEQHGQVWGPNGKEILYLHRAMYTILV